MAKTNKCVKKYTDKHGRVKTKKLLADLVLATRKYGYTGGRIQMLVNSGERQVCALGALGLLCFQNPYKGYDAGSILLPGDKRKHTLDDIVTGNDKGERKTRLNRLGDNFVRAFGVE